MANDMILTRLIGVMVFCLVCAGVSAGAAQAMPGPDMSATLTVWSNDPEERFLGSAFVFGDGRTVITNEHVVARAESVILETMSGERQVAQVVATNAHRDLALLAPERGYDVAYVAVSGPVHPGAPVYAIGAPLGTDLAVTAGIVSATERQIDPQQPVRYLQHSAPVNPGSSGGPLLDMQGQVIGINTRIADGSRFFVGIAYAVPVADILSFVSNPRARPLANPGLQVRRITRQIAAALDLPDRSGVLVEHVVAGGPADRAGLRAGDVLLRIGPSAVNAPGDIALILHQMSVPKTATVRRDGAVVELALNLSLPEQVLGPVSARAVIPKSTYTMREMGLIIGPEGAVSETSDGSAGFYAGLRVGDRVLAINGIRLEDLPENWQTKTRYDRGTLLLLRLSDGSTRHVLLDPWAVAPRLRPASGANVMDQDVVAFE